MDGSKNRIAYVIALALVLAMSYGERLAAQDSTGAHQSVAGSWLDRIDLTLTGAHYYQTGVINSRADAAPYLVEKNGGPFNVSDNPLFHGASFVDLKAILRAFPGVRLRAELEGELRGI